ncbi:PREDICTED: NADP-dependent oxidoreductase domain-containing protein 1-like [Priapulus caudatus]|uniref:NADP-dependent oxidoreductase domain-containing protein 1-like n=1 Tax=Priapulus caudatus TaxID=37621 RepID=A0ABM1EHH0_PRICU|nr:PREDICTED: NADP-dependent oxidoreductase domain-containing protein 1-like [Priapulus caudatus]
MGRLYAVKYLTVRSHSEAAAILKSSVISDEQQPIPIVTGIIGAHRLGTLIIQNLAKRGYASPETLLVSTRNPKRHCDFSGYVTMCYDNRQVAARADLLILCVLPSQIGTVATDIRGFLKPSCVIYSMVCAVGKDRLAKLTNHDRIVTPRLHLVCDTRTTDDTVEDYGHIVPISTDSKNVA